MADSGTKDGRARRVVPLLLALAGLAALTAVALFVLYARGGGPVPGSLAFLRPAAADPLAPSAPAESVLRTLRLAGVDAASVGEERGTVVVRVMMPVTDSAADVELTWQTALTAGALAYPRSATVVAQLFAADGSPLLQVTAPASAVRSAAERDDAAMLRARAEFRYLPSAGGGS